MFPACIRSTKSSEGSIEDIHKQTRSIVQIYTDWANHYLEKGRSKRRVSHLASDCNDGVLLADVIESVMNTKIENINRKPKTASQMLENINGCLGALRNQHVAGLEAVSASDLQEGRLKAVLALFFALSRHKQAAKQRALRSTGVANSTTLVMAPQQADTTTHRQISSSGKHSVGSNIPLPGSALPTRRGPPDKTRSTGVSGSVTSSRASSPAQSLIPRVGGGSQTLISPNSYQTLTPNHKVQLEKQKVPNHNSVLTSTSASSKRTSFSSNVSCSAASEKSDSSTSIDNSDRTKILRYKNSTKISGTNLNRNSTNLSKNESVPSTPKLTPPNKVTGSSKLSEPKIKLGKTNIAPVLTKENKASVLNSNTAAPGISSTVTGTGIPKPTAAVKGTTKIIRDEKRNSNISVNQKDEVNQVENIKANQSVALISPILNDTSNSENTNSQLSESSNSGSQSVSTISTISTGPNSNSSESSVIYRPSSESSNEQAIKKTATLNRNSSGFMNHTTFSNGCSPFITPLQMPTSVPRINLHQPQQPIQHQNIGEEDANVMMTVKPMLPLTNVKGYSNNLTLPSRKNPTRLQSMLAPSDSSDYCDIDEHHVNGYVSEGEVLRPVNNLRTIHRHIYDGYMSEQDNRKINHIYSPLNGVSGSLTVLTEQSRPHRGARPGTTLTEEDVPPPLGPRPNTTHIRQNQSHRNAGPSENGISQNAQWKKYTDSPGVGSPIQTQSSGSPTSSRRERKAISNGQSKEKSTSKVRVPQSFGYMKRNSVDSSNPSASVSGTTNGQSSNSKTAHVSAVPRTKVKVSGGTQTCSSDLQVHQKSSPSQYKSYSLTGHAANQLSQSVRERLLMGSQSLPKPGASSGIAAVPHDYNFIMRQGRPKASDGSLSDTQATESSSSYASWLRHSNTYSMGARLADTDSLENLSSLHGHRSSLTHNRLLRDSPSSNVSPTARLSRSNSIRSTKSEKLYPSMLMRGAEIEPEPYYCLPVGASHWSHPTSPAPGTNTGASHLFPLSPTHSSIQTRHGVLQKNDEVHGSSISLVSTTSSLYSTAEEKQAHEIRKLRRELMDAQEKVHTLTSQLSTNAHVVSAFEKSLSSMTQRLQHLTATAEKKDSELAELRAAMENLRTQSLQAGLSTGGLARQPSSDSVSSMSSACSIDKQEKKKKKGWLRSSFTKAFSRNAKQTKINTFNCGESNMSGGSGGDNSTEQTNGQNNQSTGEVTEAEVEELQKQLREKDMVLTDIRLEALSSAHQLESLKDTVMKMRSEMLSLKQNNERLQRMVGGSLNPEMSDQNTVVHSEPPPDVINVEENALDNDSDGRRISISVYLGQPHTFDRYYTENYTTDGCQNSSDGCEIIIAYKNIGSALTWSQLDGIVRRTFKQHVLRIDPVNSLGLGSESIAKYRVGEAERSPDAQPPALLPVGYIVGRISTLHIILQPICALSFEALIPRGVAQRLINLLTEHYRIVLCGPPGTGKTHLAQKLAHFYAQSQGKDSSEAVATFNVDHKSGKELRQYLSHLGEQASGNDRSILPSVVVLDNLHRTGPLNEALGTLPRTLPCLIGTMAQAACSTTTLQLQHGFRWVLVAPHLEPASGLLSRVLNRRIATLELTQGEKPELTAILSWLPKVWKHLNKFLETHSSGDVVIGPRLFLVCPLDLDASKAWFSDVWNYSLAPYLREAAKEGLQLYGRRAPWIDPVQYILDTYPWTGSPAPNLTRIGPQDVGLESSNPTQSDCESDPLLNMLMRLQEAANYSSPHSNDSDCASLDSNITHESSIGTESIL